FLDQEAGQGYRLHGGTGRKSRYCRSARLGSQAEWCRQMFGMATQAPVGLWQGLAVALGVGLLMGIERERHQPPGSDTLPAGVRSFALVALAGWLAALLGQAALLVVLAGVAALAVVAYWRSSGSDPGVTSE